MIGAAMDCEQCGSENRPEACFCAGCGVALEAPRQVCRACAAAIHQGARFCDACGEPVAVAEAPEPEPRAYTPQHLAERILAQRTRLEGERKQVTVLFADVSGSMDLAEQTDAEAWRTIMDGFFAVLCEGVHRFEGTVVQFTGDGIMALFGAPLAHEDHASRAAWAALHLRGELSHYAARLRREQGLNFSTRIGLNSGEVIVGSIGDDLKVDYTAIGHTVGLAQRMESLAEPGSTYVTEHTAALLEGLFEMRDLGPFAVKGVRDPVGVSELIGAGRARTRLDVSRARGLSRFVGRTEESGVLEAALGRALEGRGQVIGVVGEPGVGKSRLCDEFVERCRRDGITVYGVACQAHARNVPFHAALEMLRAYFGIADDDAPQEARERIAGRLLLLDSDFAQELPLVFDFLGVGDADRPVERMDPAARQRRLLSMVRRLVHAHSERELAVNVFEDLHWIDGGSAAFLEALVEAAPSTRSLVVVNFRPEYRAEWMGSSAYQQLPVVPLGMAASDELLRNLLGDDDPSLEALAEEIRGRSGGNPFFVEEIVQGLIEDGTLVGDRGAFRLGRPIHAVAVPPTVQAVLAARIDRLSGRDKALLQAAAVLGKEFGEPVLERVAQLSGPDLAGALRGLVAAEFLYELALFPEPLYAFRHPLTQEVAYRSQLADRRRRVHAAVAHAMLELYSDRLDERAALLAHHFESAGEIREAVRWHARAAAWVGASDLASALEHWTRVRDLAAELPEDAESVALGLAARTWRLQLGWRMGMSEDEASATFAEAEALARRTGDDDSLALVSAAYAAFVGLQGAMPAGLQLVERPFQRAKERGNQAVLQAIRPIVAYARLTTGDLDGAAEACQELINVARSHPGAGANITVGSPGAWGYMMHSFARGLQGDLAGMAREIAIAEAMAGEEGDTETLGWALQNHAVHAFFSGTLDRAGAKVSRSLEIAESIGSPFSRVWARYNVGLMAALAGDWDAAVAVLEECIALVEEVRTGAEVLPWAHSSVAWARAERGEAVVALEQAERALATAVAAGLETTVPYTCLRLATVARLAGCPEPEIWATLEHGLASARGKGSRGSEALIRLERAELAHAGGDAETEAVELREAVRLFELNGADGHLARLVPRLAAMAG